MVDVFTKEKRSQIMRQIKDSRNKSTELKLIKFFKSNAIKGWRRNYKLYGKPDFTFPNLKIVVFVDGCFWHGHDCRNTKPQTNSHYWNTKIHRNRERDKEVTKILKQKGWITIRIWECDLKKVNMLQKKIKKLMDVSASVDLSNGV